ncbi:hypothetical protein DXA52_10420 [Bacteroides thetaiotaomicron]|nr:hypothetical protein DXA52_10420 [Bacteroides thetaiotaomicron]
MCLKLHYDFFLFANLSIFRKPENFLRKNFLLKCNFDITIWNIFIDTKVFQKNTYFCIIIIRLV